MCFCGAYVYTCGSVCEHVCAMEYVLRVFLNSLQVQCIF